MNFQEIISKLLDDTKEIMKLFPTVGNVRHVIKDIPYHQLIEFAKTENKTVYTDQVERRVYIIYSPYDDGVMDTDIWFYSTVVKIKPAEVIEETPKQL